MERQYLESVIKKGNTNSIYLKEKRNRSGKLLFYYLIICLFSKRIREIGDNIYVINRIKNKKKENEEDFDFLYYGITFSSIKDLRNQTTFVSAFSRGKRFRLLLRAIREYKKEYCGLGKWCEIIFIDELLNSSNIQTVMYNGHYDRLTTELSEICNHYNVKYFMKQHGLVSNKIAIPEKIKCDKCIVFDEIQADIFRSAIIENKDCNYEIKYNNKFDFREVNTSRNVGIIDAPFDYMEDMLDLALKHLKDSNVYIMKHPLRSAEYYNRFSDDTNIFVTSEKIKNLDYIISCASTLAYDYIRCGFKGDIIFVDIGSLMSEMDGIYENLKYVDDYEEMVNLIMRQQQLPADTYGK